MNMSEVFSVAVLSGATPASTPEKSLMPVLPTMPEAPQVRMGWKTRFMRGFINRHYTEAPSWEVVYGIGKVMAPFPDESADITLRENAKAYKVTVKNSSDSYGSLHAITWVQEGVSTLVMGAANKTMKMAVENMRACGLAMNLNLREAIVNAFISHSPSDFYHLTNTALMGFDRCLKEASECDEDNDAMLDSIQSIAASHILHGIITGMGDDHIIATVLESISHEKSGISVVTGPNAHSQLLATVQYLRQEITGSGMDPMAQELSFPAP